MRKFIQLCLVAAISSALVGAFALAGPGIGISKTAPLSGTGSAGDPLKITTCLAGSAYVSNGTSWACTASGAASITGASCSAGSYMSALGTTGTGTCTAEVGDISSVGATANMGLTGGATSGAALLGLLSTCADGQVLKSGATGTTWTCANDLSGGGGITNSASANYYGKSDGTNIVNGVTKDDGTNWTINTTAGGVTAKFTVVEASGNTSIAGTLGVTGTSSLTGNVGLGAVAGTAPLEFAQTTGQKEAWYPVDANRAYGVGVSGSLLKFYVPNSTDVISLGYGISGAFTSFFDFTTATATALGALAVNGNTTFGDANTDKVFARANVYSVSTASAANKPAVTSCGTSPGVVGGSAGFRISVGTASPTACTATFATAFDDIPACIVTRQSGTGQWWPRMSAASASAITIDACNSTACGGNAMDGTLHVVCIGASISPGSP